MTSKNIDLPKVSVILTTFNREYFFTEAIESILEQDYPNLEIIISDDGSSDNSGIICDDYGKKDKRIRVFHTNCMMEMKRSVSLKKQFLVLLV